jgi:hypothetical protein
MARIRFVAAIAILGVGTGASFAACTSSNPSYMPYAGSGSSGSGGSGTASGSSTTGAGTTGSSASGMTSSSGTGSHSGGTSATCDSTRYFNPEAGAAGSCVCAGNAYSLDGGACSCQTDTPTLCHYDAGQAPLCVDPTTDTSNCGGCGLACPPTVACNNSKCGNAPTNLVPSAPGCVSMRVVYDSGNIYWADMGHGTIASIPAGTSDSGAVTTIVAANSNQYIAAIQTPSGPKLWPAGPISTALLVHAGTVYWIGAASPLKCPTDGGTCTGGVGSTIMSATAGSAPKTLLKMSMDPAPSPVSDVDAAFPIETPGVNPPILAIALSPDFSTIYFAAGTRFYSIPATGAVGAPTYVGYAEGPEHGQATALAADSTYLYYPTDLSGNVEILTLGMMCDPDAAANEMCPARISESQGNLVYDTITIKGTSLYWGNDQTVRRGDVAVALTGSLSGDDFPSTLQQTSLTGFVIGTQNAYFGETGQDNAGYIEKGAAPPFDGDVPNAVVIARGQPQPMSFALDGTNVYWTTSNCDINYIADSPQ